jgi:hypothetical protein
LPLQPFSRIKQIRSTPHPQAVAEFPRNMESCPAQFRKQTSKPVSTSAFHQGQDVRICGAKSELIIQSLLSSSVGLIDWDDFSG